MEYTHINDWILSSLLSTNSIEDQPLEWMIPKSIINGKKMIMSKHNHKNT